MASTWYAVGTIWRQVNPPSHILSDYATYGISGQPCRGSEVFWRPLLCEIVRSVEREEHVALLNANLATKADVEALRHEAKAAIESVRPTL